MTKMEKGIEKKKFFFFLCGVVKSKRSKKKIFFKSKMSSSQGKTLASISVGKLSLSFKTARKSQDDTYRLIKEQLLAIASVGVPAMQAILDKRSLSQIQAMKLEEISALNGKTYVEAANYLEDSSLQQISGEEDFVRLSESRGSITSSITTTKPSPFFRLGSGE